MTIYKGYTTIDVLGVVSVVSIVLLVSYLGWSYNSENIDRSEQHFMEACVAYRGTPSTYECVHMWSVIQGSGGSGAANKYLEQRG